MIVKEKYTKSAKFDKLSGAIIFFADKNFNIKNINTFLDASQKNTFKKNLNKNNKKKIFSFDISHDQKIVIFSQKNNSESFEKNGAELYEFLKNENLTKIHIIGESIENQNKVKLLHELIHGMKLKSYLFDKYKSKKKNPSIKCKFNFK